MPSIRRRSIPVRPLILPTPTRLPIHPTGPSTPTPRTRPTATRAPTKANPYPAPVERVDDELRRLADDMLETMYGAPGVGLAAIQVGVPRRLVVLDVADDDELPQPLILVNPEIVTLGSQTRVHEEGCLSIPDC